MLKSMYSGISGLQVHQTKMDVIGNNISNVNTLGFKSSNVNFSDVLYQTSQAASGPTQTSGGVNAKQVGLGAQVAGISQTITTQGGAQRTDNALDVMINGDSFFIVKENGETMFTKNGAFKIDAAGNLAMESGPLVMGWKVDPKTEQITRGQVQQLQIRSKENLTAQPEATTNVAVSGNIDETDEELVEGKVFQIEFYDNKGGKYTATYKTKDTSTDGEPNGIYSVDLTDIVDNSGKSIFINQVVDENTGKVTKTLREGVEVTMGGKTYKCRKLEGVTDKDGSDVFEVYSDVGELQNAQDSVTSAQRQVEAYESTITAKKAKVEAQISLYNKQSQLASKEADRAAETDPTAISTLDGEIETLKSEIADLQKNIATQEAIIAKPTTTTRESEVSDITKVIADATTYVNEKKTDINTATTGTKDVIEGLKSAQSAIVEDTTKSDEERAYASQMVALYDDILNDIEKELALIESVVTADTGIAAKASAVASTYSSADLSKVAHLNFDKGTGKFLGTIPGTENSKREDSMILHINDDKFKDIDVDFSTMTNFNADGVSNITSSKGSLSNNGAGAGCTQGKLSGVSISQNGMIYGAYSNGKTKLLGQIAVANFTNPAGLEAVGGSMFTTSLNSGDFDGVGVDITTTGGKLTSGALEMSNVDLSSEFTNMVTAQRGFQANSRVITTSDTLLEELVNLKR